jgi:hypothetical protein
MATTLQNRVADPFTTLGARSDRLSPSLDPIMAQSRGKRLRGGLWNPLHDKTDCLAALGWCSVHAVTEGWCRQWSRHV